MGEVMKTTVQNFGVLSDGTKVSLFTVKNKRMSFSVTDYGCRITSIVLHDSDGIETDVVLGYSTLEGYIYDTSYFGAFVGRFANRIKNASFTLDGKRFTLDKNDGRNMLHGGFDGWDKKVWKAKTVSTERGAGVEFTRVSKDGEQGFPGNMRVKVRYILDEKNNLTCRYTASSDKACPVNLTNHSYFNLAGKGTIENHVLKLDCPSYLETTSALIPTGKILSVKDTPYDFLKEKRIGRDIEKTVTGYDDCFVTKIYDEKNGRSGVPESAEKIIRVAELCDPQSGRTMTVDTNAEGIQLYTGNMLKAVRGKNGRIYGKHAALCLETECFPDSPNIAHFPSCVLLPGKKYESITVYGFRW